MHLSFISELKSPTRIILSQFDEYKSNFLLLIVNDYLSYLISILSQRCMSSKLTIFSPQIYFNNDTFCWQILNRKKFNRNVFSSTEQNSSTVNVSVYSKRFTKTFDQKLTFWKLLSIFVSEIISRSTLLARSFAMNSNLFLIELMLR